MSNTEFEQGGDATAVVKEVKAFLGTLSDRTPQEALGIAEQSSLISGTVTATIGFLVLLAAATVIPHFLPKSADRAVSKQSQPAAELESDPASPTPTDGGADAAGSSTAAADTGGSAAVANPDQVLDTLGIGEAKEAPSNKNPREDDLDKLLDGIK